MGTTLDQLDAELSVVEGIDTNLATAVNAVLAALQAKIPPTVDVTAEFTRLQNIATALTAVQSAATAAVVPADSTPAAS